MVQFRETPHPSVCIGRGKLDELKQLVGWLESPVVRRYQQLTPEIQKGLSEKLVAETRSLVEPKLQALDRSVTGRLGLPPPAKAASAPAKK